MPNQDAPVQTLRNRIFSDLQLDRVADPQMLTRDAPRPDMTPKRPPSRRGKLYRAGEIASFVGNGLDLATTLDFLYHGGTEHNPIFGARPNPAVLALAKAGSHLFNKLIMRKLTESGVDDRIAGAYGIAAGALPFKAGWQNLTGF